MNGKQRRQHYYEDVLKLYPSARNLRYLTEYDEFGNAVAIHCLLFQREGHRGLHQERSFNSFNDNLLKLCFNSNGDERYDLKYDLSGITPEDHLDNTDLKTIVHTDIWEFYKHIGYEPKKRNYKEFLFDGSVWKHLKN